MLRRLGIGIGVAALSLGAAGSMTIEETALSPAQTAAVVKGVGSAIKDPESARYRLPALVKGVGVLQEYCGCVNAKNAYGGYTGPAAFYGAFFTAEDSKLVFLMIGGDDKPAGVSAMCAKAGYSPPC